MVITELPARPVLELHQGVCFRYAMPEGWRATETACGVDMIAPDGQALASAALLVGAFGPVTPAAFIRAALPQIGMANASFVSTKTLLEQPGLPGQSWKIAQVEVSDRSGPTPVRAWIACGVQPWFGRHSAITLLARAPEEHWPYVRHWLPALAQSVVVIDPRRVAGQDQVLLPRGFPYDETARAYRAAWPDRDLNPDQLSSAPAEAMMGYVEQADPQTGRRWALPLEAYDTALGGFRNPLRPAELLVSVSQNPTGERPAHAP